jgi:hypothetical protein
MRISILLYQPYQYRTYEYLSVKIVNYRVCRYIATYILFPACMLIGYVFSGTGKNLYTMGYMNGFVTNIDFTHILINSIGGDDAMKYKLMVTLNDVLTY